MLSANRSVAPASNTMGDPAAGSVLGGDQVEPPVAGQVIESDRKQSPTIDTRPSEHFDGVSPGGIRVTSRIQNRHRSGSGRGGPRAPPATGLDEVLDHCPTRINTSHGSIVHYRPSSHKHGCDDDVLLHRS